MKEIENSFFYSCFWKERCINLGKMLVIYSFLFEILRIKRTETLLFVYLFVCLMREVYGKNEVFIVVNYEQVSSEVRHSLLHILTQTWRAA